MHALAWGATPGQTLYLAQVILFQSTPPAWGATPQGWALLGHGLCFNPRPRVGGDDSLADHRLASCCFNPRSHMGSDNLTIEQFRTLLQFQSTPPACGATPRLARVRSILACFNPRPRVAATEPSDALLRHGSVSIHAPCVGSDVDRERRYLLGRGFNPRPVGGDATSP
jgi:hypothetical protein